jgi:two-component system sensor histidine kinase QseC
VADQAAAIDASTLQTRFPAQEMPLELRPICERLNELLARLEQSFERERRFSADAAHELRTPIAELRSLAEVALKWPSGDGEAKTSFADTLAAARQMEGIVNGLLAITRCEAGKQRTVREQVEVAKLVDELWQPFVDKARSKELSVTRDVPAEARLETDRALFGSILNNLLSNAVEYTPPKGSIRIRYHLQDNRWVVTVANAVGNLRAEDLPHLFQRFWRKDTARSTPEHSGLGLSLARAFAETLGMTLRAELVTEQELALTLEGGAKAVRATSGVATEAGRNATLRGLANEPDPATRPSRGATE